MLCRFAHLAFCKSILLPSWNLVCIKDLLKCISVPILVGIQTRFMELWSIFCIKKVEGLSHLQGKPLEGIGWNLACRCHLRSAFLWLERNLEKDHRDMTQNQTGVKIMRLNLYIKIHPIILQLFRAVNWKSVCTWISHHWNSLQ